MKRTISIIILYVLCVPSVFSQELSDTINIHSESIFLDGIFAHIGDDVIFYSDIDNQIFQYETQGLNISNSVLRNQVIEELFLQKIMLHFASIDSVVIDDSEIENTINQRIDFFKNQLGTQEKVEEYFQKSITELRLELNPVIKNQLLIQKMQYEITKDVDVSPLEVSNFYNNLSTDSIPVIESQYQIAQILKTPIAAQASVEETLSKLEDLRNRILQGADFATMAILYSEDPGSSRNGGAYFNVKKGFFVKEFEAVSFSLGVGEISEIFETEFGYHIVELIDRRGNEVDVRHILMTPKISNIDMRSTKEFLANLKINLLNGEVDFLDAVKEFSTDQETRYNGGLLINPNTNNSFFSISELEKIDPVLFNELNSLSIGEMTDPIYIKLSTGKEAYRIIKLVSKKDEHIANLKDDYSFLKNYCFNIKKEKVLNEWYRSKITDIHISSKENLEQYSFYKNLIN